MAVLFRYELKKLFNRKLVWLVLALCMAIIIWSNWSLVLDKAAGQVDGMRSAYRTFEGRIATDAASSEAKVNMGQYVAAHPGGFTATGDTSGEGLASFPKGWDYDAGVWNAYNDIGNMPTVEAMEKERAQFTQYLKDGRYDDGTALPAHDRRFFQQKLSEPQEPIVIHYAEGWKILAFHMQGCGYFILMMLALGLILLFPGETTARMEGILLTSAKRQKAMIAKLLLAACYGLALTALLCGLPLLIVAMTYGLDGASWPASTLTGWIPNLPGATIGQVYLLSGLVTAIASVACAAVAALASSLFRHPLSSLLGCAVLFGVQFIPSLLNAATFSMNLGLFGEYLEAYSLYMPVTALASGVDILYSTQMNALAIGLLLSALIAGFALWLAQYSFLKRRKA